MLNIFRSDRGAADQIQPKLQPYMDYMMVDSPQSSHLMQRLEPYTYQKYAYQDEEGRSLNLVDGDMSSIHSRGSGHRPHPLNKDTQLLQDLVSVLLSSPAQPTSHHQVATPLSTPPFFQGLNFPLDYSKGYISQVMKVSSQQHKKKTPKEHGKIAGLDGECKLTAAEKTFLEQETGLDVLQTGVGEVHNGDGLPVAIRVQHSTGWVFFIFVGVACVGGLLVGSLTIACLRSHAHQLASGKLALGPETGSSTQSVYQVGEMELWWSSVGGVRGGFSDANQPSPSSHSSTPSWGEEPAQSNMDISTGHMILAYMEDHVKNKDRLLKEWEALCSYQAEFSTVLIAQSEGNTKKNRCSQSVPYDHSRVKLKAEVNPSRADYINASTIIEHDPRMPAYIATQGPLSHTISDFWQMVWENGCTVIVMMTALVEDGEKQCDRYWPDEGSSLYHIYEVNLVSEHIWCNDFLVRSFYVKNVQTQETRTLTQFHFLSWPAQGIPTSTRPLLDFRRKVNKCYRGRSCPIIVHCSDGTGRTGTYILIDMVLNRMTKGVKEIDIAATLEHIRDQRPGMVCSKDQFEFALTAVAEEVNAILKALPQ
uniref:Protein tyrosine phosphatase receptor type Nb n=1 Tax=Electrophorus electricus TaxID=8005 RepID=A0AAY5EEY0_ELEEL